jgi:hypothetical protein
MEPAGRRSSGFLQVKEFSTGKGIKPHRQVSFLRVKEKRQGCWPFVARTLGRHSAHFYKLRNNDIGAALGNTG